MNRAKYFQPAEFTRCTPPCTIGDMKQHTLSRLDTAREIAGIPFVLTSAYRSREHELSKGRTGDGAHTTGEAVDIRCNTDRNRCLITEALMRAGFTRIGIARTYIHADDCPRKTPQVLWLYE